MTGLKVLQTQRVAGAVQRKLEGGSFINADATGADGRSNVCCSRRRTHATDPKPALAIAESGRANSLRSRH
jgi:hypothetical protein